MDEEPGGGEPWAVALLRDGFSRVHEGIEALLAEAEPPLLRFRVGGTSNSVAWLIWHLSRIQDDHFAHLAHALHPGTVAGQCWVANDWVTRFALPFPRMDTGYGHTAEQVAGLGSTAAGTLLGYHRDVHARSMQVLDTLDEEQLGVVIDDRWDPPVTAAVRLVSILGETTSHLGQAELLRGIFADSGR